MIRKFYKSFIEGHILNKWFVLLIELCIVLLAIFISYSISIQIYSNIQTIKHPDFNTFFEISLLLNLVFFLIFKTYKGIIRYATIHEFRRILVALAFADFLTFIILYRFVCTSGSVALAYTCALFSTSLIGLSGFILSIVYTYQRMSRLYGEQFSIPVFMWGVDENNLIFAQTLNNNRNKYQVKGLIGKNITKKFRNMTNLQIVDILKDNDISKFDIAGILFTDENIIRDEKEFITSTLNKKLSIYITQQIDIKDTKQLSAAIYPIRNIQIEDLLGRPQIRISMDAISSHIKNKNILVTGAAGSIGSEIVRQVIKFEPACIVCLDQAETPLNDLCLELKGINPVSSCSTIIGNVRDKAKMEKIFDLFRPDIIYHAAAYKHVPMMEKNPREAITNNVLGTKILVDLSVEYNVEMFVMVSTDKAVNPTNIMGASKRVAEIYVQSKALELKKERVPVKTKFVTTRFGNVLGSNGSVIPLFRKQIEKGGPVTVTHPDVTRYFMTIPEACRLVLEASVVGESGYIYIFDMGQSVKIYDVAVKMIKLAGLRPGKDIQIEITGLRPGEKLYEELLASNETSEYTTHEKIRKAKVREYTYHEVAPEIDCIILSAFDDDEHKMVSLIKKLVPEYKSNNSKFESLDKE